MKKTFLFLLISATVFTACKKNTVTVDCASIATPTVSVPGAVDAGDSISFFVPPSATAIGYSWTGPNGFSSNDRNAVVPRAQLSASGKYTLTVDYGNNCTKTVTTDSVKVMVPIPPCTASPNTSNLSDTALATFDNLTSLYAGSVYSFTANGPNGKIVMQFLNTNKPSPGVYAIQPQGGVSEFGYLRFRFDASAESWQAATGKVYVTQSGNKNTYTFCLVKVTSTTTGRGIFMTGTVTEP